MTKARRQEIKKEAAAGAPAWRPRTSVERREQLGPLQEIRIEVAGSGGWIIVAQERRELSGSRVWKISALHPNHGWRGEDLPFVSDAPHVAGPVACYTGHDKSERDREIGSLLHLIMMPLPTRWRDFVCPHCRIAERDGNTGPDGTSKICTYCRKSSVMTQRAPIATAL